MIFAFISPESARVAIPVALVVAYALYHVARWYLRHAKVWENDAAPAPSAVASNEAATKPESQAEIESQSEPQVEPTAETAQVSGDEPAEFEDENLPGAEDFRRARAMTRQEIPDFRVDGLYLDLLGASADKGYAPAMAKLGDYAMRRGTWVEAYYWIYRAKQGGVTNLDAVLREIRRNWTQDGCLDEEENVNELFDEERGSIGRCLLAISAGRDMQAAKDFLREFHPEFL